MGISISDFKGNVADLARPNRFMVSFRGNALAMGNFDPSLQYLAMSTELPGRDIGDITLNWQGMQIKLAGDPTVADISLKFHNDSEFKIRNFFEEWANNFANMGTNERLAHTEYKAEVVMEQLDRRGDVIATYILDGAYPKTVSPIALDMGTTDSTEEFTVSFRYDQFYREDAAGAGFNARP